MVLGVAQKGRAHTTHQGLGEGVLDVKGGEITGEDGGSSGGHGERRINVSKLPRKSTRLRGTHRGKHERAGAGVDAMRSRNGRARASLKSPVLAGHETVVRTGAP